LPDAASPELASESLWALESSLGDPPSGVVVFGVYALAMSRTTDVTNGLRDVVGSGSKSAGQIGNLIDPETD
jgi:hypothetical protein